ncbi:hypothetical protein F5050DRAFT_1581604 [Lentinula boryana]|uniref:DUF8040 domain-containing protein n=1 Tax=Lentinula boryana TaxID=40481 RepID=A0ABQ8PZ21_9AGAR|nr:hypothetical protein F5050DRAFT_1581604 [Lentinula boryana]
MATRHSQKSVLAVMAGVLGTAGSMTDRTIKHGSILTGQAWVTEVLYGHPERCLNAFGMSSNIFMRLLVKLSMSGLCDSWHVSAAEQLAIFLYFVCQGSSQ